VERYRAKKSCAISRASAMVSARLRPIRFVVIGSPTVIAVEVTGLW